MRISDWSSDVCSSDLAQRGGLRAGGLDLAFTANVRTLVNGTLVLESVTNLTPGGTTVTQSNMPTTGVDPTTLSFVGGRGGAQSTALPAGLAGLPGQRGVVVEDPPGTPTPLHRVTQTGTAIWRDKQGRAVEVQ